ncbi:MAG: aminoglycoside 6-adenylyltransferase, partial [Chloroflexota bacterium]|nr:aminoglycoside 6-adenylyltransferase [Chloroflexota bacterium]
MTHTISQVRQSVLDRLLDRAREDDRIEGMVDYGSRSEGRDDDLSDLDVVIFVRDVALDGFVDGWADWVAGLGDLLIAFPGVADHPWTIFDAEPLPLRADFNVYPISAVGSMRDWPNSPLSVGHMVLAVDQGGQISAGAGALVGRDLGPPDPAGAFLRVSGALWYYLLRAETFRRRGEAWAARWNMTGPVTGNLCALLRLESGATARWRASDAAAGIERAISPERLAALDRCVPEPHPAGVLTA